MAKPKIAWECQCGYKVYVKEPPEECPQCNEIDSFIKLPKELINELNEEEEFK